MNRRSTEALSRLRGYATARRAGQASRGLVSICASILLLAGSCLASPEPGPADLLIVEVGAMDGEAAARWYRDGRRLVQAQDALIEELTGTAPPGKSQATAAKTTPEQITAPGNPATQAKPTGPAAVVVTNAADGVISVDCVASEGPMVVPWKTVKPDPAYHGWWLVCGDLDGDKQAEVVTARRVPRTQYVAAAVATKLDGTVLWRWGTSGMRLPVAAPSTLHYWIARGRRYGNSRVATTSRWRSGA